MWDSSPSPGRSLATVAVMLIAFAVFAALVALDRAAGVSVHRRALFAAPSATPIGVDMAAAHKPDGVPVSIAHIVLC